MHPFLIASRSGLFAEGRFLGRASFLDFDNGILHLPIYAANRFSYRFSHLRLVDHSIPPESVSSCRCANRQTPSRQRNQLCAVKMSSIG